MKTYVPQLRTGSTIDGRRGHAAEDLAARPHGRHGAAPARSLGTLACDGLSAVGWARSGLPASTPAGLSGGPPAQAIAAPSAASGGSPAARPANWTGMPDSLKATIESLSGFAMDDVRVHFNSLRPARLGAVAMAQGTEIHLGPGHARHLPHEAWHVVQQKQGRVAPTLQQHGEAICDDPGLESEADRLGALAAATALPRDARHGNAEPRDTRPPQAAVVQRKTGFEVELDVPAYMHPPPARRPKLKQSVELSNEEGFAIEAFLGGGLIYGQPYGVHPLGYYHLTADHGRFLSSHAQVVNMMVEKGFVEGPFFFRDMSNLEYITPPFDEVTPTAMEPIAESLQKHAVATAEQAAQPDAARIPAPAVELFTGVPVAALKRLCHGDNGLISLIDALPGKFDRTAYIQETTGILPSEIPKLFKEAAGDLLTQKPKEGQWSKIASSRFYLLTRSVKTASTIEISEGTPENVHASIRGYFTLLAQYAIAAGLEAYAPYRSGTPKNLVAYLSKAPLETARLALPEQARNALQPIWNRQGKNFNEECERQAEDIAATTELGDFGALLEPKALGLLPNETLEEIVVGRPATTIGPGTPLEVEPVGPADGKERLKVPGEQLIPVEDRILGYKTPPDKATQSISGVLGTRWQKAFNRRQASLTNEAIEELQARQGEEALNRLLNVSDFYLGDDDGKLALARRILGKLGDSSELDVAEQHVPGLKAKVLEADESKKREAAIGFLVEYFAERLATTLTSKIESSEQRRELHEALELEIAGVKCRFIDENNWEWIIGDAGSGTHTAVSEGRLTQIIDSKGYAAVFVQSTKQLPVLAKRAAGKFYVLKYASLGGERQWEEAK